VVPSAPTPANDRTTQRSVQSGRPSRRARTPTTLAYPYGWRMTVFSFSGAVGIAEVNLVVRAAQLVIMFSHMCRGGTDIAGCSRAYMKRFRRSRATAPATWVLDPLGCAQKLSEVGDRRPPWEVSELSDRQQHAVHMDSA